MLEVEPESQVVSSFLNVFFGRAQYLFSSTKVYINSDQLLCSWRKEYPQNDAAAMMFSGRDDVFRVM